MHTLSSVPTEAWVGLAGVLFGSLLTTLGVWLTNRANLRQSKLTLEHEDRMFAMRQAKERLEELYMLVCHWQHGLFTNYLNMTLVMKGEAGYDWYHEKMAKHEPKGDFNRIEMIIGVYAKSLESIYNSAIAARGVVNAIAIEHRKAYQTSGVSDGSLLPRYTDAELKLEEACEALKKAIAASARSA